EDRPPRPRYPAGGADRPGDSARAEGTAEVLAWLHGGHGRDPGRHHCAGFGGGRLGGAPRLRLLLDTHIWIWTALAPSRIPKDVARELDDPLNEIWVSPVSTWESLLLARRGRLRLYPDPESWLRTALERVGLREAPLNHQVAVISTGLKLPHRDPA